MKTINNITFTILDSKSKEVTVKCINNGMDDYLYRAGGIVKCNCNNYMVYLDGRVYCPSCGREAINVESDDDLHLIPVGLDRNTMQELYRLSDTIDYSLWLTVAKYFVKLKPEEVDISYCPDFVGWVTPVPEFVEEALIIRDDLRVINRDIEAELESIINNHTTTNDNDDDFDYKLVAEDIVDQLHAVFSVVETPYGEFNLDDPIITDNYIVENPLFPLNPSIGTGECWYIKYNTNEIWYVRYNYRDGDDLRMNNILIDFELKAIGKKISYDSDVEELILKLKELK